MQQHRTNLIDKQKQLETLRFRCVLQLLNANCAAMWLPLCIGPGADVAIAV